MTPLEGIVVVDCGQVYQGPYAGFLLAKAGATVIKVEPPQGEPARLRERLSSKASLPFAMLNANKQAVTLNLKDDDSKKIFRSLVARADVLIENYAPGVMDRLGLGFSTLHGLNPRLVYASATGYGLSGPNRDNLAMDLTIQAVGGVMSTTGLSDGPPMKAGPAVADFLGGIHLYAGILTALLERERSGIGRLVEISMQETVYPTLASNISLHFESEGRLPERTGNRHGGLAISPYNVYPASNGYVAIITVVEKHWQALAQAMERLELVDHPDFATNKARVKNIDRVDELVGNWTRWRSREELFAMGQDFGFPSAPVRSLEEVINDPHMHERGMLEWIDHPSLGRIVVPNSPIRVHGVDEVLTKPSPRLGQDNAAIFQDWLGVPPQTLAEMRDRGAI